jgi:hypothetical protein
MNPITAIFNSAAQTLNTGIIADLIMAIGAIIGIELIIVGYILLMKVLHPRSPLEITPSESWTDEQQAIRAQEEPKAWIFDHNYNHDEKWWGR